MSKRMTYFKLQKLFVYTVLAVLATQLIYFYKSYGYAHALLYILFLFNYDVYKPEFRNVKLEIITHTLVIVMSGIVMLSPLIGNISAYLYLPLFIVLGVLSIISTNKFRQVYVNRELDKINDRNIKLFERDNKFLVIYTYLVMIIIIGLIGQTIYSIITL